MKPKNRVRTVLSQPTGWRLLTVSAAAVVLNFVPARAHAQLTPAQEAANREAASREVVQLPAFSITESQGNPYQSQQALSASRVATSIQDIPQTISVVTSEFIQDSLSSRMLDAAKYITPIVESTLPFGSDRYTIRGFTVSNEFIDGTQISGADGYSMSIAPWNIERMEIIKGPNAILVPGGSPGGQVNPITKAPIARDFANLTLELAEYNGNDINFDVNRVLSTKNNMAFRLVGAYYRNDYYVKNQYRNGYLIAPSFSVELSPVHKLTLKAEFVQNRETNLGGVPIDPLVSSNDDARIARGLPRNWSFGNEEDYRHRSTERVSAELLSTLGDHVTSRLYVMADHVRRIDRGSTTAGLTQAGGGSINPYTGIYEPGVTWNTAAWQNDTTGTVALAGTANPVTDPSTWVYSRNAGLVDLEYTEAHIKNDYAIKFETDFFKSTTITGFAADASKVHFKSYPNAGRPAIAANNLANITYPRYAFPAIQPGLSTAALGTDKMGKQENLQVFVFETLDVWQDRILLSGGVSRYFGELSRTDNTGTALNSALPNSPAYNLTTNALSYGVVVKPIKPVSLFFSHNTTGGTMPGSLNAGTTNPATKFSKGAQDEFGIKTSLLNGRLTASAAYFDISQTNFQVTNSEYYRLVSLGQFVEAASLPQFVLLDLTSKGWEFEGTFALNNNLTLVGNVTDYEVRQPITGTRLRGVPDRSFGAYADYRFTDGVLSGFGVNVGVDFKDDVAGENASGFTTTRALPGDASYVGVPVKPSFLVEGRTLVNLGFTYRAPKWTARLQVSNLLDKEYILAAGSRGSLIVGEPRAFKGSVTYNF